MRIKNWKIFESTEVVKEMVEDLLRDISDSDIPVEVEIYLPDPFYKVNEKRVLVLIGKEVDWYDQMDMASDLPLHNYIDNFIGLNDYLVDEGYRLDSIAIMWTYQDEVGLIRRMTSYEFDDFIKNIKDNQNKKFRVRVDKPKVFRLVDICYSKD